MKTLNEKQSKKLIKRINKLKHFKHLKPFLEWLSDETYFNIPKDEIDEIIIDYHTYKSDIFN